MGIKRFQFLSRHPDIDVAEFQRIWRDERGPELMEEPAFRRNVLRYEQNHRLVADYGRERDVSEHASSFDGVEVLWFESTAAYEAFAADESLGRRADEASRRFLDVSATRWLLSREPDVIVDLPGGRSRACAKLISVFRRNAALDREGFRAHWRQRHGPLYVDVPELAQDILAYDQNPRLDTDYERDAKGAPGYDGVTEQWFESLDAFTASLRLPANRDLVAPDVAQLLDPNGVEFLMAAWPPPEIAASAGA